MSSESPFVKSSFAGFCPLLISLMAVKASMMIWVAVANPGEAGAGGGAGGGCGGAGGGGGGMGGVGGGGNALIVRLNALGPMLPPALVAVTLRLLIAAVSGVPVSRPLVLNIAQDGSPVATHVINAVPVPINWKE